MCDTTPPPFIGAPNPSQNRRRKTRKKLPQTRPQPATSTACRVLHRSIPRAGSGQGTVKTSIPLKSRGSSGFFFYHVSCNLRQIRESAPAKTVMHPAPDTHRNFHQPHNCPTQRTSNIPTPYNLSFSLSLSLACPLPHSLIYHTPIPTKTKLTANFYVITPAYVPSPKPESPTQMYTRHHTDFRLLPTETTRRLGFRILYIRTRFLQHHANPTKPN